MFLKINNYAINLKTVTSIFIKPKSFVITFTEDDFIEFTIGSDNSILNLTEEQYKGIEKFIDQKVEGAF